MTYISPTEHYKALGKVRDRSNERVTVLKKEFAKQSSDSKESHVAQKKDMIQEFSKEKQSIAKSYEKSIYWTILLVVYFAISAAVKTA